MYTRIVRTIKPLTKQLFCRHVKWVSLNKNGRLSGHGVHSFECARCLLRRKSTDEEQRASLDADRDERNAGDERRRVASLAEDDARDLDAKRIHDEMYRTGTPGYDPFDKRYVRAEDF